MGCGASSPAAVESPGHRYNQNTTGPSSFNLPLNHVVEVLEVKEEPKNVSSMEVQTRVQGGGDLRQPTKAKTIIPKPVEDISELAVRAAKREINNVVLSTVLHKEGTTDANSVIVQSSLDVQAAAAAQTEQMTDATSVIEQSSVDLQAAEAQAESAATSVIEKSSVDLQAAETQAESAATSVIEQSSVDLKAAETQAESALEELQNGDFSEAENVAEVLLSHFVSIVGSMDAVRRPVSIQDVQLPVYAKAEEVLNKYSVLGQVLVSVLQHAVSGLPFGAPVAFIIGLIYSGAAQACQNTVEAKRLLKFIQQVDRFLAKQACAPGSILLLSAYSGRGFFRRFLLSSHDKGQFTRLTTEITDAMHIISFSVAMDNVGKAPTDTTEEEPDAAKLRRAMLKAANIPDDKVIWTPEKADEVINAISPDKLAELMRTYCKVEDNKDKYILRELDALKVEFSQKMDAMQVEIYQEKAKLEKTNNEVAILKEQVHIMYIVMTKQALHEAVAESRNLSPPALRPFLSKWWKDMFKLMQRVPNVLLMSTLSKWMVDSGHRDKLCEYDETLKNEGVVPASATAFVKIVGIVGSIFLRGVLLPLLDEDKDDYVSREDLLSCQLKADKFAAENDGISDFPTDWPSMMDVLYQGFDRIQHSGIIKSIIASHVTDPSMTDNPLEIVEASLLQLEEKLKVKVIMEFTTLQTC
ncbi:hypothetical protein CEUSTIGMA_g1072.t1 [Chlamydomonas eustigma]|uniref:EF-hand domain-containing protein n=1 Tax=Chlamydomonas eustigma TaxID=1157962 RepID=A0A250WS50_9CHLO|nr:hypothetical protein CEUSTIGMA_g1072.t1 [Chlamydomonas eustigma]|eukprot:GAX73621.1 hypothetical protein CEUSTIGMA_g1072.t1 [Chlamydomonas eustigma]